VAIGIEIEGLHKEFAPALRLPWDKSPRRVALSNICLQVPPGQRLAVLGTNGAGKSTLLRILATLVRPTSGLVRVGGVDVRDWGRVRSMVGWATGDDRSFYWSLSGRANLEFFAGLQGMAGPATRSRVGEVLERVGLDDVADTPYRAYSSGMRQRLAVARALLHEPALLLLDEPTRSLDHEAAESLRTLLVEYSRGGRTLIWVTHNRAEAAECCDRSIWLREGRIEYDMPSAAMSIEPGSGFMALEEEEEESCVRS
jgi:ABC-2 type transport system ATP-binding protein